MTIFFIIILILICIFLSLALKTALDRIYNYEKFLIEFASIIEYATNKLKVVDDSGHFKSDDEIGFVFDEIKKIQLLLDDIFEQEKTSGNKKK